VEVSSVKPQTLLLNLVNKHQFSVNKVIINICINSLIAIYRSSIDTVNCYCIPVFPLRNWDILTWTTSTYREFLFIRSTHWRIRLNIIIRIANLLTTILIAYRKFILIIRWRWWWVVKFRLTTITVTVIIIITSTWSR
jgi:hypothetical protein